MKSYVMRRRWVAVAIGVWLLNGCVDTPGKDGWRPSQKAEMLRIAEDDPYLSLCDAKSLYERVAAGETGVSTDELLVRYAENLADGCIDLERFERKQKARQSDEYKTHYEIYRQRIDRAALIAQVRSGKSIEEILRPYVPKYREFGRLVAAYKAQRQAGASPKLLRKIRLNVERVKLLKPLKTDAYALVNIPEFKVRIIEKGETKVSMRVVVGKRRMQTPVFSENLQYIVLNPPWNVPESIARKEILPKLIEDPDYLKKQGMEVHRNYNLDSPKVDLDAYDLCSFTIDKNATEYEKKHPKPMPFRIVQVPSKRNGLGRVKFLFPNNFSVYMHDTQSKHLFKRKYRAYSHGCVRLAQPKKMLRYLIEHYTDTSWEEAKAMYDSMETHFIEITKPLPVHTAYLTVYVDDDGKVSQFKDIYGYDRIQTLRE